MVECHKFIGVRENEPEIEYYHIETDGLNKISDLIELLEFMKNKFGDVSVICESLFEGIGGGYWGIRFKSRQLERELYPEYDDIDDEIAILI